MKKYQINFPIVQNPVKNFFWTIIPQPSSCTLALFQFINYIHYYNDLFLRHANYWLTLAAYIAGLCVTICAFRRCRKRGYLVIACYFALVIVTAYILPPIYRAINARRAPDVSARVQQKIHDAVEQATNQVLQQEGLTHVPYTVNYYLNLGPLLLVIGLWLIARREPPAKQPPP